MEERLKKYITDLRLYSQSFLKIRDKGGRIVPLRFKPAQVRLYEIIKDRQAAGLPVRLIILKARQLGFSTECEAEIFRAASTNFGINALIVAHRDDSTSNLFKMSKLFYEQLPAQLRPMIKNKNAQELSFENPTKDPEEKANNPGLRSRIRCVTAGGGGIGRSDTLQLVHCSEFAFWPGDKMSTLLGIMQAVPAAAGTFVAIESTANGFEEFHALWEMAVSGESDWIPVFFPWYEEPDYTVKPPPDFVLTPEEERIKAAYSLSDGQMAWRRQTVKNNCGGDERLFRQEYPASPEEAFITTGRPVFDNEKILARLAQIREPVRVGTFTYDYDGISISNIKFTDDPRGDVAIYSEVKEGYPYVLGGDTAGDGSDWFVGQVLDNTTGAQAAILRQQYDEDEYARLMYCLGRYYNDALIGVETNYSTHPERELERLRYPKLYIRERMDTFGTVIAKSFGFDTNSSTRPVLIAELVAVVRDTPELICDRTTLKEMLVFAKNENGRSEAMTGEHDDCVMALGIAHMIRAQQDTNPVKAPGERRKWRDDMWEDYNSASEADKRRLIEMWGEPE